ncbi:hypothetical protein [Burkholderia stagnalis]|uniref:hypothetical protein n=1 Tax=Burkholderia stagnalis TaxID=1503054 RepID=UPI000F8119C6|nr:hypothetical protein [Burkholderia stagnalis]
MWKISFLSLLIVCCGFSRAEIVTSCDGDYVAKIGGRREVVVSRGGRRVAAAKVDHHINGGAFSLDDSVLVVFGLPFSADPRSPQVAHLSIYFIGKNMRLAEKEVYGGGVYDAAFSEDRKSIVVNGQFGVDVIDVERGQVHTFDAAHVPKFEFQKCDKK